MDVYLVRHAIAETRDPNRWPDDAERPLTRDGAERFRRAAGGLRRVALGVDDVLSSPYVRARQTAEILRDAAGWPSAVLSERLEATRSPAEAVSLLTRQDRGLSVALVGHEPFLSSLASLLLAGDEDAIGLELKKGGVICLGFPADCEPGHAVLRWHATPKLLRRLARAG